MSLLLLFRPSQAAPSVVVEGGGAMRRPFHVRYHERLGTRLEDRYEPRQRMLRMQKPNRRR